LRDTGFARWELGQVGNVAYRVLAEADARLA